MPDSKSFDTVSTEFLAQRGLYNAEGHHRPVVLVVDDEDVIADTRAAILSNWGYAVLTAYDAESALELARLIPPEILIADIMLAKMNGVDLAIAIKLEVPDCEVILFSGRVDLEELVAGANYPLHNFALLSKPVHPAQLQALLTRIKPDYTIHPCMSPALG
jgi:DNA-binding response OmpR family regulator